MPISKRMCLFYILLIGSSNPHNLTISYSLPSAPPSLDYSCLWMLGNVRASQRTAIASRRQSHRFLKFFQGPEGERPKILGDSMVGKSPRGRPAIMKDEIGLKRRNIDSPASHGKVAGKSKTRNFVGAACRGFGLRLIRQQSPLRLQGGKLNRQRSDSLRRGSGNGDHSIHDRSVKRDRRSIAGSEKIIGAFRGDSLSRILGCKMILRAEREVFENRGVHQIAVARRGYDQRTVCVGRSILERRTGRQSRAPNNRNTLRRNALERQIVCGGGHKRAPGGNGRT